MWDTLKDNVSIPSRGSGKGDLPPGPVIAPVMFQSPLGEVVKETSNVSGAFRVLYLSF